MSNINRYSATEKLAIVQEINQGEARLVDIPLHYGFLKIFEKNGVISMSRMVWRDWNEPRSGKDILNPSK